MTAYDGRYNGRGQAVHVTEDSFSAEPSGPADMENMLAVGRAKKIMATDKSPAQWDESTLLGPLTDNIPIYPGRSEAIHVFGAAGSFPPQDPVEGCKCCEEAGALLSFVIDNCDNAVVNGWGASDLGPSWSIDNAGLYATFFSKTGGMARIHWTTETINERTAYLDSVAFGNKPVWQVRYKFKFSRMPSDAGGSSPTGHHGALYIALRSAINGSPSYGTVQVSPNAGPPFTGTPKSAIWAVNSEFEGVQTSFWQVGVWYWVAVMNDSLLNKSGIKIWKDGEEEPAPWFVKGDAHAFSNRFVVEAGWTDGDGSLTQDLDFDDFTMIWPATSESLGDCVDPPTYQPTDLFGRTTSPDSLGTADCGVAWNIGAASFADLSVDGNKAVLYMPGGSGAAFQAEAHLGGNSVVGETRTWIGGVRTMHFSLNILPMDWSDFRYQILWQSAVAGVGTALPNIVFYGPNGPTSHTDESRLRWTFGTGDGQVIPMAFWADGTVYTWTCYWDGSQMVTAVTDGSTTYSTALAVSEPTDVRVGFSATLTQSSPFDPSAKYFYVHDVDVPEFPGPEVVPDPGCDECEDPGNPGVQIPDFQPGYMPTFRKQIGDPTTSLDSYICTFESGAMVLDWHTRGAVKVWGGQLIPWSGRSEASIRGSGGNLGDVAQAWQHWGQHLTIRSGNDFNDMMDDLAEGRAVILQGDYGEFNLSERCQDSFEGGHAISVYPYQVADRLLVGDPLCSTFKTFRITSLRAYAEALGRATFGASTPQRILYAVSRPWTP